MSLLRPRLGWQVVLVGLMVPPLLLLAKAWLGRRQGPRFANVWELKAWAETHGLYCRSDAKDGRVSRGLAVSTRALTWEEVASLGLVRRPGHEAGLAGILWAVNRSSEVDSLRGPPWYGECRAWGGVLVTGDPDFLDRIEADRE